MNELIIKGRGISDILIAVVDGLKGFPETLNAVFPQTVGTITRSRQGTFDVAVKTDFSNTIPVIGLAASVLGLKMLVELGLQYRCDSAFFNSSTKPSLL